MSLALVQFFILDPWKQHRLNFLAVSEFDVLSSKTHPPQLSELQTSVPVVEMVLNTIFRVQRAE